MQGCKAYRLCSVAALNELGKEWWIDMKSVQISEELFVAIMRYFMLEQEELLPQIKQGLEKKLDAMVMRELYTNIRLHQRKKKRKRLERNIWIDEVCRRASGGSFFLNIYNGCVSRFR